MEIMTECFFYLFLYVLLNNQDKLQHLQIITLIRRYIQVELAKSKKKKCDQYEEKK